MHDDDEEQSAADEATFRETNKSRFVVLTGHDTGGEMVEQSDGHAIVRKTGRAGTVAAEGDPREEDA